MGEIIHTYTDEIICPHCGYEIEDSDGEFSGVGFGNEIGEMMCEKCEGSFIAYRQVRITYSTKSIGQ